MEIHQRLRAEMGRQNHSLHNQRDNHPKIQQVQNQVEKGVLGDCKGIQNAFEIVIYCKARELANYSHFWEFPKPPQHIGMVFLLTSS